jgi:hypothetical protein
MKLSIILCIVAFGLTSCKDPIKSIEDRSVHRWQSIINSDYETAYGYFSPAYRKTETIESFKLRMTKAKLSVQWKSAEFNSKKCEDTVCEVKVNLLYKYSFPQKAMGDVEIETAVDENWINKDGNWYFLPKTEGLL